MQKPIQTEDIVVMMETKDDKEGPMMLPLLVNIFFETGMGSIPVLGIAEGEEDVRDSRLDVVDGKYVGIMLIIGPAAGAAVVPILAEGDEDSCLVVVVVENGAGGDVIEFIGVLEDGGEDDAASAPKATVDALDIIVDAFVPVQSLTASSPRSLVPDMVGELVAISSTTSLFEVVVLVP